MPRYDGSIGGLLLYEASIGMGFERWGLPLYLRETGRRFAGGSVEMQTFRGFVGANAWPVSTSVGPVEHRNDGSICDGVGEGG